MWLDKRDKIYKAQAQCLTYPLTGLHEMYTLNGNPFTWWSLSSENEMLYGRIVVYLSQEQLGYSTKYMISWNWDIKSSSLITWACQYTATLIFIT